MHVRQHGQLKVFNPKPGTPNQEAYTVIQVVVPTAQFTEPAQVADCYRYVGHRVEITLRADPLPPSASAPRPMETLWSADGEEERMRPGPTEPCSECGKVIGEDPDADFYAPLAGPSRAVCGECAVKLDDQQLAQEAEEEDSGPRFGLEEEIGELGEDDVAGAAALVTADEAGAEPPIGDRPMPERPDDAEPITTPIRRGRARAGSTP